MCPQLLRAGATIHEGAGAGPARHREGQQIFADVLDDFAARARNRSVTAVQEQFSTPLTVDVQGRPGVGRGAVAAALAAGGAAVSADADLVVLVVAEALKPEDRAKPVAMVVLNKADLSGPDRGGPLPAAERRAAELAVVAGVPVVPMIAHLATVEITDADMSALRSMSVTPVDMTSADAVVESNHPLPSELRAGLLGRLDRFGLAHAVLAVADGVTPAVLTRQLRGLSQVDRVLDRLAAVAAPARYRKVCRAVDELRTLAAQSADDELDAFLRSDEVVVAVMAAAVDVVQACGLRVDRGDDAAAHLRRAVHWRRFARGPVDALHHRCAADISRGSLRLLERAD